MLVLLPPLHVAAAAAAAAFLRMTQLWFTMSTGKRREGERNDNLSRNGGGLLFSKESMSHGSFKRSCYLLLSTGFKGSFAGEFLGKARKSKLGD